MVRTPFHLSCLLKLSIRSDVFSTVLEKIYRGSCAVLLGLCEICGGSFNLKNLGTRTRKVQGLKGSSCSFYKLTRPGLNPKLATLLNIPAWYVLESCHACDEGTCVCLCVYVLLSWKSLSAKLMVYATREWMYSFTESHESTEWITFTTYTYRVISYSQTVH